MKLKLKRILISCKEFFYYLITKLIMRCLRMWLKLFFKVFFTQKYIKIIFFLFLKNNF